jgi:NAD(P)H-hydrate repair Nnr-like enzyme with NAD(P)H-hydrate epimerase domain
MNDLYTVAQIRAIEAAAAASLPPGALMQRAGQAAANVALAMLAGLPKNRRSVLLLAGPGNNGGDALEAAANLAHTNAGVEVSVLHLPAGGAVSPETADALAWWGRTAPPSMRCVRSPSSPTSPACTP